MKRRMDVKKILISFLAIASLLLLTATLVSAIEIASINKVEVDGIDALTEDVSIIAGDTINVKVFFTAVVDLNDPSTTEVENETSNVRVKIEIEGEKQDVEARTDFFDVIENKSYVKTLSLKVPYNLKDELSEDLTLNVKIWNSDFSSEINDITLRIQRPSYNADIISIDTENVLKAGELFPVEIVLKNKGYNDLDDLYVTAKISALGVEKTAYFGDLVSIEPDPNDDDDTDTVSGKIYLKIPYNAEEGKYILEVEVSNDDIVSSEVKEIIVENEFPEQVIKISQGLLFVNPTNDLKIYKVVSPLKESIVSVEAGSSETLDVVAESEDYVVNVLTMDGKVVGTFTFTGVSQQPQLRSPIVVLTVVLAIVFLVLLIVLIALLTKKPEKTEELGESYY